MQRIFTELYRFSFRFIQILSLLFTIILFVAGFLFTCYADNMETQKVLSRVDNPFLNLLGILMGSGLLILTCRFVCRNAKKRKSIVLLAVLVWTLLLGGVLILFGKTVPAADAWSVYSAAECLARGDMSVIHPTDSYLSYYPQQVGLMAFFELLIRLWYLLPFDLHAYHFIKILYVLLTCVSVFFQYRTVHLLWEDDRADCIYLILAGANLPLIMYSSFVYGEIPSFTALSVGFYLLIRLFQATGETPARQKLLYGVLSLTAFVLAVMLRKNSLIFIIAILLVTTLEGLRRMRKDLIAFALLCAALSLLILPCVQRVYELRAHNDLKTGVPAMSYFAMGMQESSRANGWYNGFNFETYQSTDMDTAATVEISKRAIAERRVYFKEHPDYAAAFYFEKFLSQWCDGTYASRQATLATFGGRHPVFQSLYEGDYSRYYIAYGNLYQNLLYLGSVLFCISAAFKKRIRDLWIYLPLIAAFGGFLFHMIWEANARYIFLYGLSLMPYASRGISLLSNTSVLGRFRKNNTDRKSDATDKQATVA